MSITNEQAQTTTPTPEQGAAAAATQPEENGERTFTQDEVNRIVSERLARERAKTESTEAESIRAKEIELTQRENSLLCKEYIHSAQLPSELLDVFSTDDAETFKQKVEKLRPLLRASEMCGTTGCATANNRIFNADSAMREAFDLP